MIVRRLDYYDLIELPSGRHIPVPIAIELVGIKNILKIPVSRKKMRDHSFYWCDECAKEFEPYTNLIYEGSFFKCQIHNTETRKELELKYIVFKELVRKKQFWKMRYIVATITNGWILVNKEGKIIGRSFFGSENWELLKKIPFKKAITLCKNFKRLDKTGTWLKYVASAT
jgi:hypothetical protein